MKLYIYRGLDDERVPKDVTHVIVDENVTVVKEFAFIGCEHLVSVIMGDNVKRIEDGAFCACHALRLIRLSKTLQYIGYKAFFDCRSLEALFLPSTVTSIENEAFVNCQSLRLLILPNNIDLNSVGTRIVAYTAILQTASAAGVGYEFGGQSTQLTDESIRRVNEWLVHHMDDSPFHTLCYESLVTPQRIIDHLDENSNDGVLQVDPIHAMTALHVLSMNPHAPVDTISALLDSNMEAVFCLDNQDNTPLDYARDNNVGGLVGMVAGLCNHRNSFNHVRSETNNAEYA